MSIDRSGTHVDSVYATDLNNRDTHVRDEIYNHNNCASFQFKQKNREILKIVPPTAFIHVMNDTAYASQQINRKKYNSHLIMNRNVFQYEYFIFIPIPGLGT